MGGCRCYFRNCHVSNTKFPRMHFFRFPLKDTERCKKWRYHAKMEHMLEFTEVRQKNTTICARHFHMECFMNYKMDRLVPSAVPTLMRLSDVEALDYELDDENGVLVTLEKCKSKHLIPPDNFESPLNLFNDKILMEQLNELRTQDDITNIDLTENMEYASTDNAVEYEEAAVEKHTTTKTLVNSVEILETIQVTAANTKRSRTMTEMVNGESESTFNNKRCRILNTTNYSAENVLNNETIILTAQPHQIDASAIYNGEELDFIEAEEIENPLELDSNNEHMILTPNNFTPRNSIETGDGVEFVEMHQSANDLHETQSDIQVERNAVNNQEFFSLQNELLELKKKCQDYNVLKVKISILENENAELKIVAKENEELNKKLITLQVENTRMKRNLKDHKILNDKLNKYTEENIKLKDEVNGVDILTAELVSQQQETKELKKLLELLKSNIIQEQTQKQQFKLDLETERTNNSGNEAKLKEEITDLKRNLQLSHQQLKTKDIELKNLESKLYNMKNEKDRFLQCSEESEQPLNNIKINFDSKTNDYKSLKSDYDNLQLKYATQASAVVTSNEAKTIPAAIPTASNSVNSFTKAQLFNGIKRYLSSAMVSLLRMEMFGSSEREWKSDERQVTVDILRLGEVVYKYFTDEWRFHLPALRDARNWLSQSQQIFEDEDL